MSKILSILWEWRFFIVLVIAAVLFCCFQWEKAKAIIYAAIAQAKRYAKDAILNSGTQQEDYVVMLILGKLPAPVVLFVGRDNLRKLVKWLYYKLKDYMDDGVLNESQKS